MAIRPEGTSLASGKTEEELRRARHSGSDRRGEDHDPFEDDAEDHDEDEDEDEDEEDDDEEDEDDENLPATFTIGEAISAIAAVGSFCRPYLPAQRRGLILIAVGLLIETAFNVLMPLSLMVLVDDVLEESDWNGLMLILGVLGAAGLVTSLVSVWYERLDARITAAIVADMRARLFQHLHDLPAGFYHRVRSGAVLSRFSVDMAAIETSVVNAANWASCRFSNSWPG